MPSNELSALVAEMEAQHARLVAAVAEKDPDVLVQPQPNGRWTALENIRHMLFRDEAFLINLQRGSHQFSAIGIPPDGLRGNKRVGAAGTAEPSSAAEVLDAWSAVQSRLRPAIEGRDETLVVPLQRHIKHMQSHVLIVERLLRKSK